MKSDHITLQTLALPDPEITSETGMFLRGDAGVMADPESGSITLQAGSAADFGTYFNLFNLGTWSRNARLDGLRLVLRGAGRVRAELMVGRLEHDRSRFDPEAERPETLTADAGLLLTEELSLSEAGAPLEIGPKLGAADADARIPMQEGLLWLRLVALEDEAVLSDGSWQSGAARARDDLSLAICVTSYRREAETTRMAERVTEFLDRESASLGAEITLIISDNGQTLVLPPHPRLTVLPNANLGGSGGFARGLAEARTRGASHVLFMDDDAAFMMENLRRTVAFLRLARSARAAVAGAMISAGQPTAIWENGAVFYRRCHPLFIGANLLDPVDTGLMELRAARPKPANFYGGWWFFAFPIAAITHDPFPFFVRGDDISFSLANRFDTVTLPGVVSFQEDFAAKQSPQTFYLDLRNHLHHHLVHASLDIGAYGSGFVALRFIARALVRMHYDSADAMLMAWEDVMSGPVFFKNNIDMSARRAALAEISRAETWRDVTPPKRQSDPKPPPVLFGRVMKYTANGLLIPLFRLFGRHVMVPIGLRGQIWPLWGARRASFYDASFTRGYSVRHSKRRGWRIIWRAAKLMSRWVQTYEGTRVAHRIGYDELTTPEFWQEQFAKGPEPSEAPARTPEPVVSGAAD